VGSSTSLMPDALARDFVITLIINYFPMQNVKSANISSW